MKKYIIILMIPLLVSFLYPASALSYKFWLLGKVQGNTRGNVITIKLMHASGGDMLETSTNKFGYFAFSDSKKGTPSQYKLMVFSGTTFVKEVSLKGVRAGGRAPDISLK